VSEPTTALQTANEPMSIVRAAIENKIDPDKLGKLLDLAERWEEKKAAEAASAALAGFQGECPMIRKTNAVVWDGREKYKFASYEDVMAVAQPLLTKHGISVSFSVPDAGDGMYQIVCHIRVGSHAEDRPFSCQTPDIKALAAKTSMNEAQAQGAWMSYWKRYALCSALGIVVCNEDNDVAPVTPTEPRKINSKEMTEINTLIEETSADVDKFLAWLGVESLSDARVPEYQRAVQWLRKKLAKQKKEAAKP
jgi:hypothetical protein